MKDLLELKGFLRPWEGLPASGIVVGEDGTDLLFVTRVCVNPSFFLWILPSSVRLCVGLEGDDVLPAVTVHLGHLLSLFLSSFLFFFVYIFFYFLLSYCLNSDSWGKWANKLSTRFLLIPDIGMWFLEFVVGRSRWAQTRTSEEIDDPWIRSRLSTIWSRPS